MQIINYCSRCDLKTEMEGKGGGGGEAFMSENKPSQGRLDLILMILSADENSNIDIGAI